jgi:hypothetical protein
MPYDRMVKYIGEMLDEIGVLLLLQLRFAQSLCNIDHSPIVENYSSSYILSQNQGLQGPWEYPL